jgi:glutamyl-tRNA synthetase
MMEKPQEIRTRFAPSPTGYLHIGGARTALFNWLFARHYHGKFILRVEDSDVARSSEESIKAILESMEWLGLNYDEGPFFQSQRFKVYEEFGEWLLKEGIAYRCYCTPVELEGRRAVAIKEGRPPKYDGYCKGRRIRPSFPYALRFEIKPGKTTFKDLIKGRVEFDHNEIEDFVILRSNRTSTYNLCVVVDDETMGITHVIRGDDHLNNTPKQILLYEALDYPVPEFAHLPMILGSDKTLLSKRHGATSVMAYKEMGYLPHALINYLARLGWSYGDQEIFSIDEMVNLFSLENAGKSSGVFNSEKLLWLNAHYIKETIPEELAKLLIPFLEAKGYEVDSDNRLPGIVETLRERSKTLVEMAEGAEFYFRDDIAYDEKAAQKFLKPEIAPLIQLLCERLEALSSFDCKGIEGVFEGIMDEKGLKLGKIAQPTRVALTGGTISPGIFETIEALGREKTVERLKKALEFIKKHTSPDTLEKHRQDT